MGFFFRLYFYCSLTFENFKFDMISVMPLVPFITGRLDVLLHTNGFEILVL